MFFCVLVVLFFWVFLVFAVLLFLASGSLVCLILFLSYREIVLGT